jgi:hypothetical protein
VRAETFFSWLFYSIRRFKNKSANVVLIFFFSNWKL